MNTDNIVITVSLKDAVSAGLKEIRARLKEVQDAASGVNGNPASPSREETSTSVATASALREKNRVELEELATHGQARTAALQTQADAEVALNKEKNDKELEQDQQQNEDRLEQARGFAGAMTGVLDSLHTIGLVQGKVFLRAYQSMAVIQTTIDTYKAAQSAYAQGAGLGGAVTGAIMAAIATAAGMARVASIRAMGVKGYAYGGLIDGSGQGLVKGADRGERADNVLIRATPGEYMFDRPTVRHYGLSVLEALRQRRIPRELLLSLAPSVSSIGSIRSPGSMRTAYALGGEISGASLPAPPVSASPQNANETLTVINVMDIQHELDRALSSARGRRLLVNILGEEGLGKR